LGLGKRGKQNQIPLKGKSKALRVTGRKKTPAAITGKSKTRAKGCTENRFGDHVRGVRVRS